MQTVFQREDSAICRGSVGLAREIEAFCSSLVVQKCYTQDQSLSFVEVGRRRRSLVAGDGLDRKRTPDTIEPHLAWLLPDLLPAARSFTGGPIFYWRPDLLLRLSLSCSLERSQLHPAGFCRSLSA